MSSWAKAKHIGRGCGPKGPATKKGGRKNAAQPRRWIWTAAPEVLARSANENDVRNAVTIAARLADAGVPIRTTVRFGSDWRDIVDACVNGRMGKRDTIVCILVSGYNYTEVVASYPRVVARCNVILAVVGDPQGRGWSEMLARFVGRLGRPIPPFSLVTVREPVRQDLVALLQLAAVFCADDGVLGRVRAAWMAGNYAGGEGNLIQLLCIGDAHVGQGAPKWDDIGGPHLRACFNGFATLPESMLPDIVLVLGDLVETGLDKGVCEALDRHLAVCGDGNGGKKSRRHAAAFVVGDHDLDQVSDRLTHLFYRTQMVEEHLKKVRPERCICQLQDPDVRHEPDWGHVAVCRCEGEFDYESGNPDPAVRPDQLVDLHGFTQELLKPQSKVARLVHESLEPKTRKAIAQWLRRRKGNDGQRLVASLTECLNGLIFAKSHAEQDRFAKRAKLLPLPKEESKRRARIRAHLNEAFGSSLSSHTREKAHLDVVAMHYVRPGTPGWSLCIYLLPSLCPWRGVPKAGDMRYGHTSQQASQSLKALLQTIDQCGWSPTVSVTVMHHALNPAAMTQLSGDKPEAFGEIKAFNPYAKADELHRGGEEATQTGRQIFIHGHTHYFHVSPDRKQNTICVGVPALGGYCNDDGYGFAGVSLVRIKTSTYAMVVTKHPLRQRWRKPSTFLSDVLFPSMCVVMIFDVDAKGLICSIDSNAYVMRTTRTVGEDIGSLTRYVFHEAKRVAIEEVRNE